MISYVIELKMNPYASPTEYHVGAKPVSRWLLVAVAVVCVLLVLLCQYTIPEMMIAGFGGSFISRKLNLHPAISILVGFCCAAIIQLLEFTVGFWLYGLNSPVETWSQWMLILLIAIYAAPGAILGIWIAKMNVRPAKSAG